MSQLVLPFHPRARSLSQHNWRTDRAQFTDTAATEITNAEVNGTAANPAAEDMVESVPEGTIPTRRTSRDL